MSEQFLERNDVDRLRHDIDYLRERIDRIYDEVHRARKTDWVALGTMSLVILAVGGMIGNMAMSPIAEKLTDHAGRLASLEAQVMAIPGKMEEISKEKVNALRDDFNKKNTR